MTSKIEIIAFEHKGNLIMYKPATEVIKVYKPEALPEEFAEMSLKTYLKAQDDKDKNFVVRKIASANKQEHARKMAEIMMDLGYTLTWTPIQKNK